MHVGAPRTTHAPSCLWASQCRAGAGRREAGTSWVGRSLEVERVPAGQEKNCFASPLSPPPPELQGVGAGRSRGSGHSARSAPGPAPPCSLPSAKGRGVRPSPGTPEPGIGVRLSICMSGHGERPGEPENRGKGPHWELQDPSRQPSSAHGSFGSAQDVCRTRSLCPGPSRTQPDSEGRRGPAHWAHSPVQKLPAACLPVSGAAGPAPKVDAVGRGGGGGDPQAPRAGEAGGSRLSGCPGKMPPGRHLLASLLVEPLPAIMWAVAAPTQ